VLPRNLNTVELSTPTVEAIAQKRRLTRWLFRASSGVLDWLEQRCMRRSERRRGSIEDAVTDRDVFHALERKGEADRPGVGVRRCALSALSP
jgi:hypothetical protein